MQDVESGVSQEGPSAGRVGAIEGLDASAALPVRFSIMRWVGFAGKMLLLVLVITSPIWGIRACTAYTARQRLEVEQVKATAAVASVSGESGAWRPGLPSPSVPVAGFATAVPATSLPGEFSPTVAVTVAGVVSETLVYDYPVVGRPAVGRYLPGDSVELVGAHYGSETWFLTVDGGWILTDTVSTSIVYEVVSPGLLPESLFVTPVPTPRVGRSVVSAQLAPTPWPAQPSPTPWPAQPSPTPWPAQPSPTPWPVVPVVTVTAMPGSGDYLLFFPFIAAGKPVGGDAIGGQGD